jgi:uncharacterized protein (DUF924 family)
MARNDRPSYNKPKSAMAEMNANYEDILDFWLAPGMEEVWYANDPKFDAGIRDRFTLTYEAARDGKLDAWRSQARSLLALIIVLDQFRATCFAARRALLPPTTWHAHSAKKQRFRSCAWRRRA